MKKLIFVLFVLALISCNKEEETMRITLSPNNITYNKHSGDVIRIEITGYTPDPPGTISIKYCKENELTTFILDTSFSSENFSFLFEYVLPSDPDTAVYNFYFTISDNAGNSSTKAIIVNLFPIDVILTETSGHEFFSHTSNKDDGYSLSYCLPMNTANDDTNLIHVADCTLDSINYNTLSRTWKTFSTNKFVRYNDFNYANATSSMLRSSYLSGLKRSTVDNIQSGDVILTKTGNPAVDTGFVAIKILFVIDDDSSLVDRYVFSIKK